MIVSDEHKFVYVSTPKSGTHTMFRYLEEEWEGVRQDGAFHRLQVPPECREYFVFTTVRNPFPRAVSCWWHLLFRDPYRTLWRPRIGTFDFVEFCRFLVAGEIPSVRGDVVCMSQHEWLLRVRPAAVLHLETLEAEFLRLPFVTAAGVEAVNIPRRRSNDERAEISDYGNWREIMTDPAADLIRQWACGDFEQFGYSRDWRAA